MTTINFKFENGDCVKDIITGFEGVVVGMTGWLTGCNTVGIVPTKLKEDKPIECQWFDETRCVLVNNKEVVINKTENTIDPGGPLISIPMQTNRQ